MNAVLPGPGVPPCPGFLSCPDVFRPSSAHLVKDGKSTGGFTQPRQVCQRPEEIFGSSPSSGTRTPQLPGPTILADVLDFEPPDSEVEWLATAKYAGLPTEEPDSAQAPPPRLPGAWTSLTSPDIAAIFQLWSAILGSAAGSAVESPAPERGRRLGRP